MPRAQRRADIVDPLGRNAQGIAAAFALALGFQEPSLLFFRLIGRPVVASTLDIETGMRKSAEAFGDLDQARTKKTVWQGVAHLAFEADFDRGFLVELAMSGIDRQHDMNQLMDEDAQHFDGIGDIRANDDFKVGVFGR